MTCRLVILCSVLVALMGCRHDEPAQPIIKRVKTIIVSERADDLHYILSGRVKAAHEVNLAFEVPGKIDLLPANVGDKVNKGSVIARLNQENYLERKNAANAQYRLARSESQRMIKLMASKNISQTQLDAAQTRFDVAASHFALSQKALKDTVLKAPFSGTIVAVFVDNYSYAQASEHVVRMVDTSELEFMVDIPELWVKRYREDAEFDARVQLDAFPKHSFAVKLKELNIEASSKTRSFSATFVLSQPDDVAIFPGMAGQLYVNTPRQSQAFNKSLLLPLIAVFTPVDLKSSHVWVVQEGVLQLRPVTLGAVINNEVEILSGLNIGDEVVVAGVNYLKESQRVKSLHAKLNDQE